MPILEEKNIILPGGSTCPGCAGPIAARLIYNVIGSDVIQFGGGGCGGMSPRRIPRFSLHHSGVSDGATGILKALKVKGRTDVKVLSFAGDGATSDTSFGKVSAAANRNDNTIFFCCDNEAFMNTGVQKSQLTPFQAWTRTTPKGKPDRKKNLPMIIAQHYVPYVATATVAYFNDFIKKLEKAKNMEGFRYFHILQPCPSGWRYPPEKTVEISRLAVQTRMWNLYEIDEGTLRITQEPNKKPVEEYIKPQGRFRHIKEEQIKQIQKLADSRWKSLKEKDGKNIW